jgi:FtsH-binding integral membrane protein
MNMFEQHQAQMQMQTASYDVGLRQFMLGVYNYMTGALVLTGLVAWFAANSTPVMSMLYVMNGDMIAGMKPLGWVVAFAPLAVALGFGFAIERISTSTAQLIFWGFAALMGLSLASLFFVYTGGSITRVFFITAIVFGSMSLYGYTTKRDLTSMGSFLIMGVWGILIASLVNMFLQSSALYWTVSVLGVLIFTGLIAYDTQRLKAIYYQVAGSAEAASKASIMGALSLYLDFINLFIMLLRFLGERR